MNENHQVSKGTVFYLLTSSIWTYGDSMGLDLGLCWAFSCAAPPSLPWKGETCDLRKRSVSAVYQWWYAHHNSACKTTGLVSREKSAPLLHVPTKDGVLPPSLGGSTTALTWNMRGVLFTRSFFTDSCCIEEAEVEVRQLHFLLILTPFPANFAQEIFQGSMFSLL